MVSLELHDPRPGIVILDDLFGAAAFSGLAAGSAAGHAYSVSFERQAFAPRVWFACEY